MSFKSKLSLLCVLSGFMLTALGCQTAPTRYDVVTEGQWSGRILVKDKRRNRSQIVSVDINAVKDQKIRADVTAALGTPVASLVVNGDRTQYVLFQQKAFYQGVTRPHVMAPILSLDMDPLILHNVLFEHEISKSGWKCDRDEKGFLKTCEGAKENLKVEWSERKGRKKTVKIDHPRASLQISFETYQPKVAEKENLFNLKAPTGITNHTVQ